MSTVSCYVCNERVVDWRRNLNKVKSHHSSKPITEFVNKFLDGFETHRNVLDESNCVCIECLKRIDEYDLSCIIAERMEKDLRKILLKTEECYVGQEKFAVEEVEVKVCDYTSDFDHFSNESFSDGEEPVNSIFKGKSSDEADDGDEMKVFKNEVESESDEEDYLPLKSVKESLQSECGAQKVGVRSYKCLECEETFHLRKELESHERWHRRQRIPDNKCQKCFLVLDDKAAYDEHVKLHEGRNPLECVYCGKTMSKKSNLHIHMKSIHSNRYNTQMGDTLADDEGKTRSYKCLECEDVFATKKSLELHERWHRQQRVPEFRCPKCFLVLDDQISYDRHSKLHLSRGKLECVYCGKTMSKKSNLHIHMRIHTDQYTVDNQPSADLKRRVRIRYPDPRYIRVKGGKYECNECSKTFAIKKDLKHHLRKHRIEREPEFRCEQCYMVMEDKQSFDDHVKLHENKGKLECVFCDKILSKKSNLHSHMRIHANIRKFICSICGKSFIHNTSFTIHMKFHLSDRQVQCPQCPMKFVSQSNLNRHLLSHTKEKNHACSICGNKFRYASNMREHERLHTESDKTHLCSFCGASFARLSKLNHHLQKNHSTNLPHSTIENALDQVQLVDINDICLKTDQN